MVKSINSVIEEAYAVLYPSSKVVDPAAPVKGNGHLFVVNNTPGYARREIIPIECAAHSLVQSSAAQVSRDGRLGYLLVEAGSKRDEMVGTPKGLFADTKSVSGASHPESPWIRLTFQPHRLAPIRSSSPIRFSRSRFTRAASLASTTSRPSESSTRDNWLNPSKELLPEGQTGGMVIMEDHPNFWEYVGVHSLRS